MNIQLKSMQAELVPVVGETDGPGTFHAIISSEKRDRDGETLWADEWKTPLPEHIQIVGDHDNNHIMSTVGSGMPVMEADKKIHVRGSYADTDYAQNARKLVNGKHLRHLSVAYREEKGQKGAVSRELINASFVNVPSNIDAVVLDSKSYDGSQKEFAEMVVKQLSEMTPADRLQAIHDMSFNLGAQCFSLVDAGPVEVKSAALERLKALGLAIMIDEDKSEISIKDATGILGTHKFSQAPEGAPPKGADPQADQAEKDAAALEILKASAMSMQTRHLIDEGELNNA